MKKYMLIPVLIIFIFQIQAQNNSIKPINNTDWEVWYKKIPVSGEIRTGIVAELENTASIQKSFYVLIPDDKANFLCVEISSNDGRYAANLEFDISGLSSGIHEFDWPTIYYKDLQGLSSKDITIKSSVGKECGNEENFFVLSSWVQTDFKENAYIILNSEKKSRIRVYNNKTKETLEFECLDLEDRPNVAFNSSCSIPISVLTEDCEVFIIQRVRRGSSISFNRYPIKIKI
jgi:hypothetical protein